MVLGLGVEGFRGVLDVLLGVRGLVWSLLGVLVLGLILGVFLGVLARISNFCTIRLTEGFSVGNTGCGLWLCGLLGSCW